MKMRRTIYALLALLTLAVGGIAINGLLQQLRQDGGRKGLDALRPGVDVELRDVRFSETRNGVHKYLLSAESATYSAKGISQVRRIEVFFYDAQGKETMRLRADSGDLAGVDEQQINLRGDVVLTGAQGFVLKTEHLTYRKADDRLITDAAVSLESPQGRLRGRGLIAMPQQERLTLLHDVQGEFGGKFVELKAGHGET